MTFDLATIGGRIHYARIRKGWTQAALAKHAGRADGFQVSRWETNKTTPANIRGLATTLGVRVDWLLLGTGEMEA